MWSTWVRRGAVGGLVSMVVGGAALGGVAVWAASTAEQQLAFPDTPYPEISASDDPELIERGRYLVHGPAHCSQCHSTSDRENPHKVTTEPLDGGLSFELGPIGTLYARNLTPDPITGIGRHTDAELARVLRTGVLPEGSLSIFMRVSASNLSDSDIRAVISYLRSLEPVQNEVPPMHLTFLGKVIVKFAFSSMKPRSPESLPVGVQAGPGPSVERGAYLAEHVMLCIACHSDRDEATFETVGPKAGGGVVEPSHGKDSHMEYQPPNLTAHPTGYTGRVDEDAFVQRMHAGRAHASSIMPWEGVQATTEDDLRSVYRYLRTLPPVDRDTGPGYRPIGWKPPR